MFALLRVPQVQTMLADTVSDALAEKLGTRVEVKRIDLRLFNRIIIDGLCIYDQHAKQMLRAGRTSATIDLIPLFEGRVSISSAQLFGANINIYKNKTTSPLNCQFVIDSLKSKDTTSTTSINLRIASLIIRNGSINYDQWDKPTTKGRFTPYHIHLAQLSSHIILYRLTDQDINFSLNRLSFREESGVNIKNLTADIETTDKTIKVKNVSLVMPRTKINVPYAFVSYKKKENKIQEGSLKMDGKLVAERISPIDFSFFIPINNASTLPKLGINATIKGSDSKLNARLSVASTSNNDAAISLSATARDILNSPRIDILINKLALKESLIKNISSILSLPQVLNYAGDINAQGRITLSGKENIAANININTSNIGKISTDGTYKKGSINARIAASRLNLAKLTNDKRFGDTSCSLVLNARINGKNIENASAKGDLTLFTYNSYAFHNTKIDLSYASNMVSGLISIQDPNIALNFKGNANIGAKKGLFATVEVRDFCPGALRLTQQFGSDRFAFDMKADIKDTNINDIEGSISLDNVSVSNLNSNKGNEYLNNATATISHSHDGNSQMIFNSDFATINVKGQFTPSTLPRCFANILHAYVPALNIGNTHKGEHNDFSFDINIKNLDFVKRLVDIPLEFNKPIVANGFVNSLHNNCNISIVAPGLNISGTQINNTNLELWTTDDSIRGIITSVLKEKNGPVSMSLECEAGNNELHTVASWDNMRANVFRGRINILSHFFPSAEGTPHAQVSIPHSSFEVGDTVWNIHSQGIDYTNGRLSVNRLAIENQHQHLLINGIASKHSNDTITAELKDINIAYILNLVNFHSVEFDGWASGSAQASSVLSSPTAVAELNVKDFRFERGRLGNLHLDADYKHELGRINIKGNTPTLDLAGNISPTHNSIDLQMDLSKTPLEFMNSFCGSFLHDIDLAGNGNLRLHGPFNGLELEGQIVTDGAITLSSTNCRYTLENDTVVFVPGNILFKNATLKDCFGNIAYLNGGVHHRHLGRISYDINANTNGLLAYNYPALPKDETYCGYALIRGMIGVHGKGNEVNINADCTALPGSFFTYDASSPEAIRSQDFITWGSANDAQQGERDTTSISNKTNNFELLDAGNDRANIRLNFMVNVTPEARLNLIMDKTTGDYVDLFGAGTLHIEYYNKGSLGIFGNYGIDHGTYKMTIQNLMRRDFSFQRGGSIAFTGDPYKAILNLQAAYKLNSVSLADLNIGTSFKSNNVPVNCLMDITGTPEKPSITFGLDLPSLSSDARQMVYSIINSGEEMNQQVLYLLAVGRFLSQTNDDENAQRTKQSTLAMQSFLSGTLSQQLSNILGQVTGNTNWSLGANITPGAEGFNNGVYEGLLSGRMFNNRLLFNGQFGYRDNINTNTQNFIGDFSLQYLLTPNGSFSLKMYNQANDRYFTRSSLNTQGIGIVIQKEFGK